MMRFPPRVVKTFPESKGRLAVLDRAVWVAILARSEGLASLARSTRRRSGLLKAQAASIRAERRRLVSRLRQPSGDGAGAGWYEPLLSLFHTEPSPS
jgi:hypothetical protein